MGHDPHEAADHAMGHNLHDAPDHAMCSRAANDFTCEHDGQMARLGG